MAPTAIPRLEHPAWCSPVFCTGVSGHKDHVAIAMGKHHSQPIELDHYAVNLFSFPHQTPEQISMGHGAYAWLTLAVAPWSCSPYLRIGLWTPNHPDPPVAVFSLEMSPRHTIDQKQALSPGERLSHLCLHALSEAQNQAGRTLKAILAERDNASLRAGS